jgi:hypothetical protein
VRVLPTLSILVASLVSASALAAQSPHPIVGAWERFSIKDSTGTDVSPPPPAAFTIFSAEGFYSQTAVPKGRPKLQKPLADYTKEELLARFTGTEARHGQYTVSVSRKTLTRTYTSSTNPNAEGGAPQVQNFRIDGDVLILTSVTPGNKSEARFRRAKKQ